MRMGRKRKERNEMAKMTRYMMRGMFRSLLQRRCRKFSTNEKLEDAGVTPVLDCRADLPPSAGSSKHDFVGHCDTADGGGGGELSDSVLSASPDASSHLL
jgi:hypothetical protein